MTDYDELLEQVHSRLTPTGAKVLFGKYTWKHEYLCACGNRKYISKGKVNSGHTKSCGCLRREVSSINAKKRIYPPMTEHRKKEISEFFKKRTGDKNPSWKGGKTKIQESLRSSSKYKEWRNNVFKRDNWTCQECFRRGNYLEAHHIKPFISILREIGIESFEHALSCLELWSVDNGKTLCLGCHNKTKEPQHLRIINPKPLTRVLVSCRSCGKTRSVYPSYSNRPFCNRDCYLSFRMLLPL